MRGASTPGRSWRICGVAWLVDALRRPDRQCKAARHNKVLFLVFVVFSGWLGRTHERLRCSLGPLLSVHRETLCPWQVRRSPVLGSPVLGLLHG